MRTFNGYTEYDVSAPLEIQEFFIITEPLTPKELLKILTSDDDYYVVNHGQYVLFINSTKTSAYALTRTSGAQQKGDRQVREEQEPKESLSRLGLSRTFLSLVLCCILLVQNLTITQAAVSARLAEDGRPIAPLEDIVFKTATSDLELDVSFATVTTNDYTEIAYSLGDPRRLTQESTVSIRSLPTGINKEMISTILLYKQIYTLDQIRQSTGLNIVQDQLDAAIQLSVWRQSALVLKDYQVVESSITDATVRSLSTAIDTWATTQINNKVSNLTIFKILAPLSEPKLDASRAQRVVGDSDITFGPYSVTSATRVKMTYEAAGGFIVNASGQQIQEVTSGETFFVKYPLTSSAQSGVTLTGVQHELSLGYSTNRVWIHHEPKPFQLAFSLSTTIGSNGIINVHVVDILTGLPLENIEVTIKTPTAVVGAILTNTTGNISQEVPVGTYTVSVRSPNGYISYPDFDIQVGFIGDIQSYSVELSKTLGVTNFYAVDATTLASAGYAEAYIFSDNVPVKRIRLDDGRCTGIELESGTYMISIYKTSGTYSISSAVTFTVQEGLIADVNVPLTPTTPMSTLSLENTKGKANWKMSIYNESRFLFSLNTTGSLQLPLAPGLYGVIAEAVDGSIKIPRHDFVVTTQGVNEAIPVLVGTEQVTFQFVDTVIAEPIPRLVVGLFDDQHRLLQYTTADEDGFVVFDDIVRFNVYYVNIVAAPDSVSGYSAVGNRFLGDNRSYTIPLYSSAEIREVTKVETLFRIQNVVYNGSYVYPDSDPVLKEEADE